MMSLKEQIDRDTVHHFSSGVYAKQMFLPKGAVALTHKHKYDHLSILAQGAVVLETPEGRQLYRAPVAVTIRAGVAHGIMALEDSVWFCIHATDETDPAKVDEVVIQK
jgi:quercetin dioxygenase-like cupin family protein